MKNAELLEHSLALKMALLERQKGFISSLSALPQPQVCPHMAHLASHGSQVPTSMQGCGAPKKVTRRSMATDPRASHPD